MVIQTAKLPARKTTSGRSGRTNAALMLAYHRATIVQARLLTMAAAENGENSASTQISAGIRLTASYP